MAEELPETADGAIRGFIALFILGAVLEGWSAWHHDETQRALEYWGVGAMLAALGVYWKRIRIWAGPHFTATATAVATDFRYWIAAVILIISWLSISPYVEERRWPFLGQTSVRDIRPPPQELVKTEPSDECGKPLPVPPPRSATVLGRFIEDFERHAAEEHYMAVAERVAIPYCNHERQGLKRPYSDTALTLEERGDWSGYLRNLRKDAVDLCLTDTVAKIDDELPRFDPAVDATNSLAWSAYYNVSTTLKYEIGLKGFSACKATSGELTVTRGQATLGPAYVKDIQFDGNSTDPLTLIAVVVTSAPKLRVVLQNSQYLPTPNGDFFPVYPSIVLGEFDNVVEGQIIRIPIVSLASPPYPGMQLVFGKKPSDTKGNPLFVNPTLHLARIFFLQGDDGEPQNYKFAFFATADPSQLVTVLPTYTLDDLEQWRLK